MSGFARNRCCHWVCIQTHGAQKEAGDWQNKVRMVMATLKRGHVDTGLQRRVLSYLSVTAVAPS